MLMKCCVIEKKYFKAYVSRIQSPVHMLYDINPSDFAHHVRHANSWHDLGTRCGYETDNTGRIKYYQILQRIKQKAVNMKINTEHFHGQNRVPDDVFIKIVSESTCLFHVTNRSNQSTVQKHAVTSSNNVSKIWTSIFHTGKM